MTVQATVRKAGPTLGNGAATVFPFAFKVFAATDLRVQLTTIASGLITLLALNDPAGYTVALNADQNANPGGSITYNPASGALPATQNITIDSVMPQTQGTHIINGGAFLPNNVEDMADRDLIATQDLAVKVNASIQFPTVDSAALTTVLPAAAQRANFVLGFDANGNVIVTAGGGSVLISAVMTPVVQAATLAAGRAALGAAASGANTDITSVYLNNTGLKIKDTDASHGLSIIPGSNITADRTLTVVTGDANRSITFSGDLTIAATASVSGTNTGDQTMLAVDTRQTVLAAALDSSGYANALSAGAGLNFNIAETTTPLVLTFAGGFGTGGSVDLVSRLTADQTNQGGLQASNTNYIFADYVSASSVTWSNCLIPPQYGMAFDRGQGALLNFEGANGAITTTDDFGNTWTRSGNAQISTAQFKFGTSSTLLDGTGDFWTSTNFSTLGDGSWEISAWFYAVATSGTHVIFAAENAAGFGVVALVDHNAGTRKIKLSVSSDGSSANIVAGTLGTTTLNLATWYKVRVVFDALAGTYRCYVSNNGGAEVQEITVSSTARVSAITQICIGDGLNAGYIEWNGYIDAFRLIRAATATAAETPAAVAPGITDYKTNFFSIPEMKMYEVTAASGAAGTNPTLTARNRTFVGEQDTSGAAVTATRNYPVRDQYTSDEFTFALNTAYSKNDNLGKLKFKTAYLELINQTTEGGWQPGDICNYVLSQYDGASGRGASINYLRNSTYAVFAATGMYNQNKAGGGATVVAAANWKARLTVRRTF